MFNALINKDKRKLVDIIMRKDDIHKKLKKDNADLCSEVKALANINKDYYDKIQDLIKLIKDKDINITNLNKQINDFKDCCDEYATKYFEIIDKCKNFKRLSVINTCITIAVLISMLILL
nr:MAG TPA: hypothetical protein [Crassvirales sp.]